MIYSFREYTIDFSTTATMLADQNATFLILRHGTEIPNKLYPEIMKQLACEQDNITDDNLKGLVKSFLKSTGPIMLMDEEDDDETEFYVIEGKVIMTDDDDN